MCLFLSSSQSIVIVSIGACTREEDFAETSLSVKYDQIRSRKQEEKSLICLLLPHNNLALNLAIMQYWYQYIKLYYVGSGYLKLNISSVMASQIYRSLKQVILLFILYTDNYYYNIIFQISDVSTSINNINLLIKMLKVIGTLFLNFE